MTANIAGNPGARGGALMPVTFKRAVGRVREIELIL
jgi:hypothetical protein